MIKLSYNDFLKLFEEKGYEPDRFLNIVGFRNRFGRVNYYDDTISLFYGNDKDNLSIQFPATTRPGTPYLIKPVNPDGAAILVPGQYKNAYSIGKHRGRYPALIQTGAVGVYRDNNRNNVYDAEESTIQRGFFGINIHKASLGDKLVGPDSAGCQVLQSSKDFQTLMAMCLVERQRGVKSFTYTLVEL